MKNLIFFTILFMPLALLAQSEESETRPITMEEYQLSQTFEVEDLDNDTYVKVADGEYILDRYEMRPPIYITGDDGLQKRVDIYKLVEHENLDELGLLFFYTNEKGDLYKALIPNYTAAGEVWEQYFEDIHAIDKEEQEFVLKLSYVISRELSLQMYKNLRGVEFIEDDATYGTDICFPGDQMVALAGGGQKRLSEIQPGEQILTYNSVSGIREISEVRQVVAHHPANYAITELTLLHTERTESDQAIRVDLSIKQLKATPNHPVTTHAGNKEIGEVKPGEQIAGWSTKNDAYELYTVWRKIEVTEGVQPVYSISSANELPVKMNGVFIRQK